MDEIPGDDHAIGYAWSPQRLRRAVFPIVVDGMSKPPLLNGTGDDGVSK